MNSKEINVLCAEEFEVLLKDTLGEALLAQDYSDQIDAIAHLRDLFGQVSEVIVERIKLKEEVERYKGWWIEERKKRTALEESEK